jgi:group II intron reverse transcriptase/maturase
MTTGVAKIAAKAREEKKLVFTSLAHHITENSLWEGLNEIKPSTATGIDGQDVKAAKESFKQWSTKILQEMHNGGYHPPPARRVYIPKPGKEEKRPISIPTIKDRCLQKAVVSVLNAIYEQDFLNCSYGGRTGRSAHQAVVNLQQAIIGRKVNWIFEADLKNFFGSLNQDWCKRFLNHRVGDPRIIKLIMRWMKAGVIENGEHHPTEEGTAQGGPTSVLISNIYLHYVLDLWIEKIVKPKMKGYVHYVRYLDDFVLCFEHKSDAIRFQSALTERLGKFSLSLEASKTKLIEFGRFAEERRAKKPETFNFLGFTFYCTKDLAGKFAVRMKTEKARLRRSKAKMKQTLLRIRHRPVREQWKIINVILNGHYRYYGIGGNSRCIGHFHYFTERFWRKSLSSRSQKGNVTWEKYKKLLKVFPLRQPKVYLPFSIIRTLAAL